MLGQIGHCIEWVGDDDENRIWRRSRNPIDHVCDDLLVGADQVLAGHAGFAGDTGGNDHHVGVDGLLVIGDACDPGIIAGHWACLCHIQGFAGRHTLGLRDIYQHNVA